MDSPLPRIFISHSHADNQYCRAFVAGLREAGADVWYDEQNLGWGALREVIEREMEARKHFIAILSPEAVSSDWVNAEIDAALTLLRQGQLTTFSLVTARRCQVPLLLQRYKRIELSSGDAFSPEDAVIEVLRAIRSPLLAQDPTSMRPEANVLPDRFPARLETLGYKSQSTNEGEYIVPPLCQVPAGEFRMGSDPGMDNQADKREMPQHVVGLSTYKIARYPVTVAEYACFVRAGGKRPNEWDSQLGKVDHPVVWISWFDAQDYAHWLARITGNAWYLPSEAQWEKAARWDAHVRHARIYPWGDNFDKTRCNTSASGIGASTPVGVYPTGASPYGAEDMAGNVWEWTSSTFKPYPYIASDGRETLHSGDHRVLRGGRWRSGPQRARAAFRNHLAPSGIYLGNGMRVALTEPS